MYQSALARRYPNGGLTPIEDIKARDVLARRVHQTLGQLTGLCVMPLSLLFRQTQRKSMSFLTHPKLATTARMGTHIQLSELSRTLTSVQGRILMHRAHQRYNEFFCEEWQNKSSSSGVCVRPVANLGVDPSPQSTMWSCARMAGALAAMFAMPTYNTPYYGTSGLDDTPPRCVGVPLLPTRSI